LAIDNLVEQCSAARQNSGRRDTVRLAADRDVVSVSVDDDGPVSVAGASPSMLKRFHPRRRCHRQRIRIGSALVASQAEIHRGE